MKPELETCIVVPKENCELEGPYECPHCHFHMMLDATFLDQVDDIVSCPCCRRNINVPEPTKFVFDPYPDNDSGGYHQ